MTQPVLYYNHREGKERKKGKVKKMMKTTTDKMMNIVNNNTKEMTATLEAVGDLVIEMKVKNIDNITTKEGEVIRIDDLRGVISTLAMLSKPEELF